MVDETTYTRARQNLAGLMDEVTETREPVLIRRRGRESVALIAADELAGWMETAYLLQPSTNAGRLLQAAMRTTKGAGDPFDVAELRHRLGLAKP